MNEINLDDYEEISNEYIFLKFEKNSSKNQNFQQGLDKISKFVEENGIILNVLI